MSLDFYGSTCVQKTGFSNAPQLQTYPAFIMSIFKTFPKTASSTQNRQGCFKIPHNFEAIEQNKDTKQ